MSNEALKIPLDLLKKVVEAVLKELLAERPAQSQAKSVANSGRGYTVYKPYAPVSEQKQRRYEQIAAEYRRNNAEVHKLGRHLHNKSPEALSTHANYQAVNKQLGDYAHDREARSLKLKR